MSASSAAEGMSSAGSVTEVGMGAPITVAGGRHKAKNVPPQQRREQCSQLFGQQGSLSGVSCCLESVPWARAS